MLGKLLGHDAAYLKAHFRRHSDVKLAEALSIPRDAVRKMRDRYGLVRSQDDNARIKKEPDLPLPAYTAQAPVPDRIVTLGRGEWGALFLVFAAALALYLRTLPPTFTGEDSGELIAAAYTLGIPHPPGYPIWTMLAKAFTFIPFGSVAWRVNFMSAFFAAAACGLTSLLALKLCGRILPAMAAGLALAASYEFWEQAIIAEVYTLNAFFVALCFVLLLDWYEKRKDSRLYAFAAVFGLGLCNHNTVALLGPVFVLFILSIDPEVWRRWAVYGACTCFAVFVTVAVHLYLPFRSMADPPMDWGNPETWDNFWAVVTRSQYSFMFTEDPRTPIRFFGQAWMLAGMYAQQFTPWLAALPLVGLPILMRNSWRRSAFLLVAAFFLSVGYLLILNTKSEPESMWVATVFYIPFYILAAVLLGCAVAFVEERTRRVSSRVATSVAAALVVASVAIPSAANWSHNDRSADFWTRDYALNVMKTLEENAIFFPAADHATFPAIYLQAVEGMRPDVTLANKYGYPEASVYQDMPAEIRSKLSPIPSAGEERFIEDWVIRNRPDRPVYFSEKRDMSGVAGYRIVQAGLLYRIVRPEEEYKPRDFWAEYAWTTLDPADTRGDYTARLIIGDVHYAKAREHFAKGDHEAAVKELDAAIAVVGENKETLNNFGSACAENGAFEDAERFLLRSHAIDERYNTPLRNLVKVYLQGGNGQAALDTAEKILVKVDKDPEGLYLKAQAQRAMRKPNAALETLQELLALDRDNPRVYREMGLILLQDLQNPAEARQLLSVSLRLDPSQEDLKQLLAQNQEQPGLPSVPGLPQIPGMPELPGMPSMPGASAPGTPSAAPPNPRAGMPD